jgi:hypothetical protein
MGSGVKYSELAGIAVVILPKHSVLYEIEISA